MENKKNMKPPNPAICPFQPIDNPLILNGKKT
jgi:hypothetical protein